MLRKLSLFALLMLSTSSAFAEQINTSRITALSCQAWNSLGTSRFTLEGKDVESVTNLMMRKSYQMMGAGNNEEMKFSYVNISASMTDILSFVFPSQTLRVGNNSVNGSIMINKATNPFAPRSELGTPWAQITCNIAVQGY